MMDISVVIVSWRSRGLLGSCLASVAGASAEARRAGHPLAVEVILVDNASGDGTVEFVRASFPDVRCIANITNRGFGAACNQGLAVARGRYVVFLNPDATIMDNALWEMYQFMENQPCVGLIGPRLEYPDGRRQPSCRSFPTFWSAAMVLLKLGRLFPRSLPMRRYELQSFRYETLRQVDQVMGACLFSRKSVLDELDGFDERFFIWFEEVDLCKRVKDAGSIVFFFPWATVRHVRSTAFAQQRVLWRQWYLAQSCRRYFWKHRRWPVALAVAALSYLSLAPALLVAALLHLGVKLRTSVDSEPV